jgi:hypothetical protein
VSAPLQANMTRANGAVVPKWPVRSGVERRVMLDNVLRLLASGASSFLMGNVYKTDV